MEIDVQLDLASILMIFCLIIVLPILLAVPTQPGAAQTAPVINAGGIVGAADNRDARLFGLARGSLFSVYGSNLAPSVASSSGLPLPTLLNGVRVKVYVSQAPVQEFDAPLLYVSPLQINAVLPSVVSEGLRSLSVEVNRTESQTVGIRVATRRFAAFTRGDLGFGPAVLQQYEDSGAVSVNGLLNPATPGQPVVLWGTGLGPLPAGSDTGAPGAVDLGNDVLISVDGTLVKPFYAGRAPAFPGVDQINFYLPNSILSRCYVPMVVYIGSVSSGPLTVSAGTAGTPCASEFGLSSDLLQRLDQGGRVRLAALSFDSEAGAQLQQSGEAWLADYDAASLSLLATNWQSRPPTPAGFCERDGYFYSFANSSDPAVLLRRFQYGGLIFLSASIQIVGPGGCAWKFAQGTDAIWRSVSGSSCQASSYAFESVGVKTFSASGSLPAPRQLSANDQLRVTSQIGGGLRATWTLADIKPDDQVTLSVNSSLILTGNIFSGRAGYVNSLVCTLSAAGNSFLIQPGDAQWAWLMPQRSASVQAAEVSLQAFAGGFAGVPPARSQDSPDIVVVLIRNGLSATFAP